MINFSKYRRFFAFGCSMTSYHWPTWADIIAQEIPESYNYGQAGGGNLFISCQVTEANLRHKFTEDDLVIVMWSGVSREDRYVNNRWLTPGNIYTQNYYDQKFIDQFIDSKGLLLRDLNLITMCKHQLDNIGVSYFMLNMAPFIHLQSASKKEMTDVEELLELYAPILNDMTPDLLSTELGGVWPQHPIRNPIPGGQTADYHPSPKQHFGYLNKIFPGIKWKQATLDYIDHHQAIVENARVLTDLVHQSPVPKRI